jgi:hypothetical protein
MYYRYKFNIFALKYDIIDPEIQNIMKTAVYFTFFLLVFFSSCDPEIQKPQSIEKLVFTGYVQKGPFINGSTVTIMELDENLTQTGRSYLTSVNAQTGSFEQQNISLSTGFVILKADGYYFNEVTGELSGSQLSLYAISDISKLDGANLNVLTHLEKSRVEYLVEQEKLSFNEAKKQAQTEVLNIFNLSISDDKSFESLSIDQQGESNAILLAVSCILQGSLTTAQLSELMADITSDIRMDGVLDNESTGSKLIDNARLLNLPKIRQNLLKKYADLGVSSPIIPDFESQVEQFITTSDFKPVKLISYPPTGNHGLNLLHDTVKTFTPGQIYSMKAVLPQGTSLRVVLKGSNSLMWGYGAIPAPVNWNASTFDYVNIRQEFNVVEADKTNDILLMVSQGSSGGYLKIDVYENGATVPTRSKTLGYGAPPLPSITYATEYLYGKNILNDSTKSLTLGIPYSFHAYQPIGGSSVKIRLSGGTWNISDNLAWLPVTYDPINKSQEFIHGEMPENDLKIIFTEKATIRIDYFENKSVITRTRYLPVE